MRLTAMGDREEREGSTSSKSLRSRRQMSVMLGNFSSTARLRTWTSVPGCKTVVVMCSSTVAWRSARHIILAVSSKWKRVSMDRAARPGLEV